MSRWPMVPLGALVRLSLDPHSVEPDRNYPIAGVYGFGRGMISRSPVLGSSIAGRQLFRIRSGQLIYSKLKAFEGAFAIVDERADGYFVSSEFPTFDINEQIADKGFLQWNFRMPYLWKHLRDQSAGTVKRRERLYPDKLLALPIPLPPLGEQRRIVDLLNRAAGIRRLREQALATARNTIPALFLQTFGDPATNPKGWPVVQLGEVIAGFQGGKNIMAGDEHSSPFRILKISAITGGVFRPDESKPAPAGYDPPPEHLVREGDLMITRANTADLVGAVAESESDHPHLLLPDKIWRFVWHRPSPVERGFVRALLETAAIRVELKKLATGTSDSMRNISQKKLKALPIPLPPLDLQRRFAARLADLRGIIAQQEAALAKARDLERALMARLLG